MQIYLCHTGETNQIPTIASISSISISILVIFLFFHIGHSQEQVGPKIFENIVDAETREPIPTNEFLFRIQVLAVHPIKTAILN